MDLVFYVQPSWRPLIRPASPKREWMDNTPDRFAYRCLPLAIANAHGWEVLNPCGFSARWNGDAGVEGVEILLDGGAAPHQAPTSLFGQGTITFHVEAIVRTPPGWNLWVGAAPNAAKDGIAPLGGVVETDWSPYSFTMNWRFTRADHWIRFEAREPFCFLFPIERGVLEKFTPSIRPIDEVPELRAQFEHWSQSRDSFQRWVEDTRPAQPADHWQKLYYRGLDPSGVKGVHDHQAKLRLAAPSGVGEFTNSISECARGKATPARNVELLESQGECTALQSHVRPTAAQSVVTEQSETMDMDVSRALAHRDWIAAVEERQQALWEQGAIDMVRDISSEEFLEHFYAPARPVVIDGELDGWSALRRWTPTYLRERIGSTVIEFQGDRNCNVDYELFKDDHRRTMRFDRFLDILKEPGASGNNLYVTAYNNGFNAEALAPLHDELGTLEKFLDPGRGMMWIGPEGTFTPLHFDLTNNLLVQIVGHKRLVIAPPSQTARLAHNRHVFSAVRDLEDPEQLRRFPEAASARCFEVELSPGQILYLPVGWWHQVRSLDFSVTLTYTNFRWPNDPYLFFPDLG